MSAHLMMKLRPDEAIEATDGKLIVHRYPHLLLCGCMSDGSLACDEHASRQPKQHQK